MIAPAAFASYPQFILWRAVTRADGKVDKLPLDHRDLTVGNAQDPALWLPAGPAADLARLYGFGVGFVFTADDPFWFIDLDDCLTPAGWSAEAVAICGALAGCAIEVSQSGRGLHLFGSGAVPEVRSIAKPGRPALFTSGRFVALTGIHASGDARFDATAVMPSVVARWFPATAPEAPPADWTMGPCDGWRGPADDDALIAKMLASTSAAGAFGGKASVRQLWEADADALGRVFPGGPHREYDASAADAALAQHLAFWTGRDCERVHRLMLRSALARDKWQREDYLRRTILGACGRQTQVFGDRAPAPAIPAPPDTPDALAAGGTLYASELAAHFEGCVYIEDRYEVAVPDGSLLTPQQFRSSGRYGGHKFMLDHDKSTRNAWEAFSESATFRPPFAHSLCFRPDREPRALIPDAGRVLYNSYVPVDVPCQAGDPAPFLDLLSRILPAQRDRDIILAWMAAAAQHVGAKFQWCPVLQGLEGNGKSVLISIMSQAVGERYTHMPNASDLSNKFNGWIDRKLFIGVEEIYIQDRRDLLDSLKPMITNPRIEIQGKGANQVTGDNRANFMLCTNHKDAIPKTTLDRRYAVFYTKQQEDGDLERDGLGGLYFPNLYSWLREEHGYAICTYYLRNYQIPDALNPATQCHRAPQTSATLEAIAVSAGPVEQAISEAVAQGDIGFRGGWISSTYFAALLDERRLRGRCPPNDWDKIFKSLGYTRHPALTDGRANNALVPDGKKSRLWIKRGSPHELGLTTAGAVAQAYAAANGGPLTVVPTAVAA